MVQAPSNGSNLVFRKRSFGFVEVGRAIAADFENTQGRLRNCRIAGKSHARHDQRTMTRPLDGITVVSLEHAIAAPFCTRQLAELGGRVIKGERPGAGDFARAYDKRVEGQSSHFVWTNRSKESLALDLKQPGDLAVLHAL